MVGNNVEINVQAVIDILAGKLAKAEAESAVKEAVNTVLTKRVADLEATLGATTPTGTTGEATAENK